MQISAVLERAKACAVEYYELTGKPLGITGEIGEYTAAKCLGLKLAVARKAGYDATDTRGRRLQVKTRGLTPAARRRSQRVGAIKLNQPWDAVLLVLLDEHYEPMEIWEAGRRVITTAIKAPGSKARNDRGALAVSKFKSIGRRVWPGD